MNNFLLLLDLFWKYLDTQMAKETKFDVHIHTAADVNVDDCWEDLKYPNYTLNEPTIKLPVAMFESPPCFGKKPITWNVEIHDESHLSLVITQVYAFKSRFEANGIQGGRINITEALPKGDYIRFLKGVDVSKEDSVKTFDDVLNKILKNVAVRVLIDGEEKADTPVAKVLEIWRQRPNMHFPESRAPAAS